MANFDPTPAFEAALSKIDGNLQPFETHFPDDTSRGNVYYPRRVSPALREQGFLEAGGANSGIEVLSSDQYAGATIGEAKTKALNLLNVLREADGVFCPNESVTVGMLGALKQEGLLEAVQFVGFDSSQTLATALEAGEIDAFFYVAGAPAALFESEAIDAERFHLLPITEPVLRTVYQTATIPADLYPFQSEPVEAIAVRAVLMTFEYRPERNAYHRESCRAVSDVSNLILTGFEELQRIGHPKWRQIDLTALPPGWEVGSCVNTGLAEDYALDCPAGVPGEALRSEANEAYRARICDTIGC